MVKRRGIEAGLGPIHPHMFRHTFAHSWLAQGANEGDLMSIALAVARHARPLRRVGSSVASARRAPSAQPRRPALAMGLASGPHADLTLQT
jgi:integrase/recombinase XerC